MSKVENGKLVYDSEQLLSELEKHQIEDMLWVCRMSKYGRGLRLHQVTESEAVAWHEDEGVGSFLTPAQAIHHFLEEQE